MPHDASCWWCLHHTPAKTGAPCVEPQATGDSAPAQSGLSLKWGEPPHGCTTNRMGWFFETNFWFTLFTLRKIMKNPQFFHQWRFFSCEKPKLYGDSQLGWPNLDLRTSHCRLPGHPTKHCISWRMTEILGTSVGFRVYVSNKGKAWISQIWQINTNKYKYVCVCV